jgi:hypothetical protein
MVICNATAASLRGPVNLRGPRVAGRLSFRAAILATADSDQLDRSGLHLSLLQAAELDLRASQPSIGEIRLSNVHAGT